MRSFVILFTILSLLACPYDCAVKVSAMHLMGVKQPACCDNCQANKESDSTDHQAPETPTPDKDGHSCLCEGAVFIAADQWQFDDAMSVAIVTVLLGDLDVISIVQPTRTLNSEGHHPPSGGRQTRIVFGSLLL